MEADIQARAKRINSKSWRNHEGSGKNQTQSCKCKKELAEFKTLLDSKDSLTERHELLPFFRSHKQLAALIGSYNSKISKFDQIAFEFPLFGDFTCDLVVGDSLTGNFCFVEFEDATPASIFTQKKNKSTPEWSVRFERGFSQIVDWFMILEDLQRTGLHKSRFGLDVIQYLGLLVIGRRKDLEASQYERLVWRSENVRIGPRQVNCITFDELFDTLTWKMELFD